MSKEGDKIVYPQLDGIRGMAFLIVLLGHNLTNNPKLSPYIAGVPKVGVWIFFVLSAFLLTNYFLSYPDRIRQPLEWGNYFVRRFARIYPLYAFVLCIYWLWNLDIKTLTDIKDHLLLVKQGYIHFWTMPVEITYYAILPFVVLYIVLVCRMNLALALLSLCVLLATNLYYYPYQLPQYNWVYGFQFLPIFVFGSVGSLVHQKLRLKEHSRILKNVIDIIGAATLLLFVLATPAPMKYLFGYEPNGFLKEKFLLIGLGSLILILSALHGRLIKYIFSNLVMRFYGKISFSGYLIHWLVMQLIISKNFSGLTVASAIGSLLLTTALAAIMYYLIERHFIKISILRYKKEKNVLLTAQ